MKGRNGLQAIGGRNATDAELILNAILAGGVLIVLALAILALSKGIGWIIGKGKPYG